MAEDIEGRTIKHTTWRIVPYLMLLYFVAFLDRVNIGFASLTMNRDLGLSSTTFGIGAGILFIGYFIFEVPSNLILHKVGARIWIARVMVTWGMVSAGMALVTGPTSFYILRFLLGVAEAGFFPGIILYLSYWFPARHRAGVTALFVAAAPLSTALGSPISGALLEMHGALGLRGWQWMFLLEAVPALVLGVVTFFFLTDRPEQAAWLAPDEREWLIREMRFEQVASHQARRIHHPLKALADPRVTALALVYFGTSAGLYTLGIWSPQIIKSFGLSSLATGFVNAVPPIAAIVAMVAWARHSDKTGERTWHVVLPCLLAAAGLVFAAGATTVTAVLLALVVVNVGVSSSKAPLWAMPTSFLSGSSAAAGIAAINSIGNLGGFAGPAIIGWIRDSTGGFAGGLYAVSGSLIISAILVLVLVRTQRNALSAASSGTTR